MFYINVANVCNLILKQIFAVWEKLYINFKLFTILWTKLSEKIPNNIYTTL